MGTCGRREASPGPQPARSWLQHPACFCVPADSKQVCGRGTRGRLRARRTCPCQGGRDKVEGGGSSVPQFRCLFGVTRTRAKNSLHIDLSSLSCPPNSQTRQRGVKAGGQRGTPRLLVVASWLLRMSFCLTPSLGPQWRRLPSHQAKRPASGPGVLSLTARQPPPRGPLL